MTARWLEVRRLFESLQELPEEERIPRLHDETGDDAQLREEVARLLLAEAQAGEFLIQPAVPALFGQSRRSNDDLLLAESDRLGAYSIVRRLDQGGVSVVYLAERCDGVFEQKVAIKVMKRGMDTASIIARFRSERQILAALDHPFIARILDGGTTSDGLPYFVMEYVEGENLTQYLEHNELGVREKLELFVSIASAVAYAHRRQVIHRDLKPANIVVDSRGRPKLLDFGLAKVLSTDPDDDYTAVADRMLTPAYASPEQIVGAPVTPASDVYSLGVVLHEMLVGSRPSADRECRLPSADRAAPRDITFIVRKALREEPERRYRSADQMREDVERHLVGLPIEARHDSAGYRLWRFIGRHKTGVAASCAVAAVLVASGTAVLWQREVAKLEHTRAERRYQELRELANLLLVEVDEAIVDMPGAPPVRKTLVTNALDHLVALESESAGDPVLQREIALAYLRLGDVQRQSYGLSPGDTAGALENFERSLQIMKPLVDGSTPNRSDLDALARCHHGIALTLRQMGDWRGDLKYARTAVEIHRTAISETGDSRSALSAHADFLQTLGHALYRAGVAGPMLEAFNRVVTLRQDLFDDDPSDERARADLAGALRNLGLGQQMVGNLKASLTARSTALLHAQALFDLDPGSVRVRSDLMRNHQQLGNVLGALGEADEGLEHLRFAASLGQELQRAAPNNAAIRRRLVQTYRDLGTALIDQGSSSEATGILSRAVELLDPWARDYQANAEVQVLLAEVRSALGRAHETPATGETSAEDLATALANYRESLALWESLQHDGHLAPIHQLEPGRLREAIQRCEDVLGALR